MLLQVAAPLWLFGKAQWSMVNDLVVPNPDRRLVARRTPEEAAALMAAAAPPNTNWPTPYTGDPAFGAFDFYNHPTRMEAALCAADPRSACQRLFIDCDDVALWFWATTRHLGDVQVITLVDAGVVGSHVICVGTRPDGTHWAFDTNGLRDLVDRSPAALCATWSAIYASQGFRFVQAMPAILPLGW